MVLDIANCSSFVSDGASVMVGKENRVAAKMKLVVPTMLSVHCICHRTGMDRYQQKYRVC